MRTLVFDFETANTHSNSACAIGIVALEGREVVFEDHKLIKTPTPEFRFTEIHGITYNDVVHESNFLELWPELEPQFSGADLWVGHNIAFDQRVLKGTLEHYGVTMPVKPTLCTVKIARSFLNIKPANLANVSQVLGIKLKHHHALSDAQATAKIYLHALEQGFDSTAALKDSETQVLRSNRQNQRRNLNPNQLDPVSERERRIQSPSFSGMLSVLEYDEIEKAALSPLNSVSAALKLQALLKKGRE